MKVLINCAGSKDLWQAITFTYLSRDFWGTKKKKTTNQRTPVTLQLRGKGEKQFWNHFSELNKSNPN